MKKAICLLLTLVMCLSLGACGSEKNSAGIETPAVVGPAKENTGSEAWSLELSTDEFGDITNDSVPFLANISQGTFSNSATGGSDLTVVTSFMKKPGYNHYIALFDLKEYNDHSATFYEYDTVTIKIKIGEKVISDRLAVTSSLTGNSADRTLSWGAAEYTWGGDFLFNALYDGEDVRCIITSGSSEYKFTLESGNLQSLCNSNGLSRGAADQTVKESVKTFLDDSGTGMEFTGNWFRNNMDKVELMNEEEIRSLLNGYFLDISLSRFMPDPVSGDYWFPYWCVYHYDFSNSNTVLTATYDFDYDAKTAFAKIINSGKKATAYNGLREYSGVDGNPFTLSIDNNILILTATNGSVFRYQCRKITDDCILLCIMDGGEYKASDLLIRANGDSKADIHTALEYAINTTLNQIEN